MADPKHRDWLESRIAIKKIVCCVCVYLLNRAIRLSELAATEPTLSFLVCVCVCVCVYGVSHSGVLRRKLCLNQTDRLG